MNTSSLSWNTVPNTSTPVALEHAASLCALAAADSLQAAFENGAMGVFRLTPQGQLARVNRTLARLLGYDSPESLLAAVRDVARDLFVDVRQYDHFVRTVSNNGAIMNFEAQVYGRDGETIWISVNAWTVRDTQGQVAFHEGILEDVTARKRGEEAQRAASKNTPAGSASEASLQQAIALLDRLGATPLSPQQHRLVREARVLAESVLR